MLIKLLAVLSEIARRRDSSFRDFSGDLDIALIREQVESKLM